MNNEEYSMTFYGISNMLDRGAHGFRPATWRAARHVHYTLFIIHFTLALAFAPCANANAQSAPALIVLAGKTPVVIDAPAPFVEASRILPAAFAQRSRALSAHNRLLAWFVPKSSLKEFLADRVIRCRVLQIQVFREMEAVRHDAQSFKILRDETETLAGRALPQITEDDADTLFAMLDLNRFGQKAGGQKILGRAEFSENAFTLCIATSTEGGDQLGGREIETSVTCATYMLIRDKIILLTVTGPELSAKELRNAMRLTREWLLILRERNSKA